MLQFSLIALLCIAFVDSSIAWSGQGQSFFGKGKSPKESLDERVASYRDSEARNQEISASIASDTFPKDLLSIILEYARDPSFQIVANNYGFVAMFNGLLYHVPFPEEGAPVLENPSQIGALVPFEFEKEEKQSEPSPDLTDSKNINEVKADPPKRSGLRFCRDLNTPVTSWSTSTCNEAKETQEHKQPQFNQVMLGGDPDIGVAVSTQGEMYVWGNPILVQDFVRTEPQQENTEKNENKAEALQPKTSKKTPSRIAFNSQYLHLVIYSGDGTLFWWNWLQQKRAPLLEMEEAWWTRAAKAARSSGWPLWPYDEDLYNTFHNSLFPLYRPLLGLEQKIIKTIDMTAMNSVFAITEREVYGWGVLTKQGGIWNRLIHQPTLIPHSKRSDFEIKSMTVIDLYDHVSVFILSRDGKVSAYGSNYFFQLGLKGRHSRGTFELLQFPKKVRILDLQKKTPELGNSLQLFARDDTGSIWTWPTLQSNVPTSLLLPSLQSNEKVTDIATGESNYLIATHEGNLIYSWMNKDGVLTCEKLIKEPYGSYQIAQIGMGSLHSPANRGTGRQASQDQVILYWVLRDGRIFILPHNLLSTDKLKDPILLFSLIQS